MTTRRRPGPVAIAWTGLLVIVALAAGATWTGAVGPDIAVIEDVSGGLGPRELRLELRNDRELAVTITGVGLDVPGLRVVAVQRILADGTRRPFRRATLSHDQATVVLLTYRTTPCNGGENEPGAYLVHTRTGLGLPRTVAVERGHLSVDGPDQPRYDYVDRAVKASDVRHRCGFYD